MTGPLEVAGTRQLLAWIHHERSKRFRFVENKHAYMITAKQCKSTARDPLRNITAINNLKKLNQILSLLLGTGPLKNATRINNLS